MIGRALIAEQLAVDEELHLRIEANDALLGGDERRLDLAAEARHFEEVLRLWIIQEDFEDALVDRVDE